MKAVLNLFKDAHNRFFHSGELPGWDLVAIYCLFFFAIIHVHEYFTLWMMMFLFLHSIVGVTKGKQLLLDLVYSLIVTLIAGGLILVSLHLIALLFG